jgi:hypothetical protein
MKKTLLIALLFIIAGSLNAQVTRLYESFESTTFPPAGWRKISVAGSIQWVRITAPLPDGFGNLPAKQGTAVAFIDYEAPVGEDWLISPKVSSPIGTGDSVVLWLVKQFSDGPWVYDSLIVRVSTTDSLQGSFTQVAGRICVHCIPIGTQNIIWRRYSFPLSAYAGQNIYLAFQHKNTDGHGIVLDSIAVSGPLTTVGIEPVSNIAPHRFALHQNYPNPFNPVTKINFDIPNAGFTKLRIYDITGAEVSTLVLQELSAGSYSISFDASHLSSGIYYCRLEFGGNIRTEKMSLVK